MTEFKRITAEEVTQAYKETGVLPIRGKFFDYKTVEGEINQCACGLGVLALKSGTKLEYNHEFCRVLGLDEFYLYGFIDGFDSDELTDTSGIVGEQEKQGFEDGKQAAKAVFGE